MSSVAFSFTGKNEAAQAAVDNYTRDYNWRISSSTRQALNDLVERSIREGIPPLQAARLIKESIGLDSRRAGALATFYTKQIGDGRSLAAANKVTARYSKKLLRSRAQTIPNRDDGGDERRRSPGIQAGSE